MKTKILGRTGIEVSENGFGALPIQRCDTQTAVGILRMAYERGINFYDTARFYTDSEEKIGIALSDMRSDIIIATKSMNRTYQGMLDELDISLSNMKTNYVDIMQLHDVRQLPDSDDKDGTYQALLQAKKLGKARFIGITSHRIDVAAAAARSGMYDTVQFPLGYLSADKDLELIDICREKNVGLIAMKALNGGLVSSPRAAFAFMAQYPNVLPIWGVQSKSQLQDFLDFSAEGVVMTPELAAIIDADKQALSGNFCRGCGYCAPGCPMGIEINNVARMELLLGRAPWQGYTTPAWMEKMKLAASCTECGACGSVCPYQLDTPRLVRENVAFFNSFCAAKGLL